MNPKSNSEFRLVYRPKSEDERQRVIERSNALAGLSFIHLPGEPSEHQVLFISSEGHKVRVSDVEMVFNDSLLMNATYGWGIDGAPLYEDTLDTPIMREIYKYALTAYADVTLPPQYVRPRTQ